MPKLQKVLIKKPAFSNYNIPTTRAFTMMPGVCYPIYFHDGIPGEKMKLDFQGMMKSYPLRSNVFGKYQIQFDIFVAPWKNYDSRFANNNADLTSVPSEILSQKLMSQRRKTQPYTKEKVKSLRYTAPSSLACFCGFAPNSLVIADEGVGVPDNKSADWAHCYRYFAYYDIMRNYYANRQAGYIPMIINGTTTNIELDALDRGFNWLRGVQEDSSRDHAFNAFWDAVNGTHTGQGDTIFEGLNSSDVALEKGFSQTGLMMRCFRSDMFTAWISSERYQEVMDTARVKVGTDNTFTVSNLIFQTKYNKFLNSLIMGSGDFHDFVKAELGVEIGRDMDIPQFLGSSVCDIEFDNVLSTVSTADSPLASPGATCVGGVYSHPRYFRFANYGTVVVMASIVPKNPLYSEGNDPMFCKHLFGELFQPRFDRIDFQPLNRHTLCAIPDHVRSFDGSVTYEKGSAPAEYAPNTEVARQPAWLEYTTDVDRCFGDFASSSLGTWVIQRSFLKAHINTLAKTVSYRFDPSPYISPGQFNYQFANTGEFGENFFLFIDFRNKTTNQVSKRPLPTL